MLLAFCLECVAEDGGAGQAKCTNVVAVTPQGQISLEFRPNSEKRLEVVGDAGRKIQLKAEMSDLGLTDFDGKPLPNADIIKVDPQSAELTAAGLPLTIRIASTPEVRPGAYVGSLLLSVVGEGGNVCGVRVPIQLTVPEAAPLSDKYTFRYYRLLPVPDTRLWFCWSCFLPVKGPIQSIASSLRSDVPLGGVQDEQGHVAPVFWTGEQATTESGVRGLTLRIGELKAAGKYDGQLGLSRSGNEPGNVSVSLIASDIMLWPILVIGFGVWLGLRVQRYLNVERTLWRLRAQEASLGVAFKESQRRFKESSLPAHSAAYDISAGFAGERKTLREKLEILQSSAGLSLDTSDETYKAILDSLKALRQSVEAWAVFPADLIALQAALGTGSDLVAPPPGYAKKLPALFIAYGEFLIGKTLTLDEFAQLRGDVRRAAQGARLWYALRDRIKRDEDRFAALKQFEQQMNNEQKARLKESGQGLLNAGLALWEADKIEALESMTEPQAELDTAEMNLRQLAATYGGGLSGGGDSVTHILTTAGAGVGAVSAAATHDDYDRERYYTESIRRWDRLLTWLAFLVATLTGLHKFYLGASFGTLKDYVGLLLWAIGTKLAVDTVGAVLGWFSKGSILRGLDKPS